MNPDYKTRFAQHKKSCLNHSVFKDLAMLILPSFLLAVLFVSAFYTYFISLALIYFILPMFYAVEQRLSYRVTGIGKENFSYGDGYAAFFKSNRGGIFGGFRVFLYSAAIFFVIAIAMFLALPHIMNLYPEANETFQEIVSLFSESNSDYNALQSYFVSNGHKMMRGVTIYAGACLYIPSFLAVFFFVDDNLSYHHVASIVLPDIDLNVTPSQARNVAKSTYAKPFLYRYCLKKDLAHNWIYYLLFSLVYGALVYASSLWEVEYFYLMPLVFLFGPGVSLIVGLLMNHFCLLNRYVNLEESKDVLLSMIPKPVKTSLAETYRSKEYIHGQESLVRGDFFAVTPLPSKEEKGSSAVLVDFTHVIQEEKQ